MTLFLGQSIGLPLSSSVRTDSSSSPFPISEQPFLSSSSLVPKETNPPWDKGQNLRVLLSLSSVHGIVWSLHCLYLR